MAVAVALVLRLGVVAATPHYRTATDAVDYDRVARSLADHARFPGSQAPGGGPTAYRAPGYPVALAATYVVAKVGIDRWTVARVAQAFLGALTVLLLALLAARLWGPRVGVAAAWLAAVHVPFLAVGATLFSENLLLPLILGTLLAATEAGGTGRRRWLVLAGVLGGAATLTHPNAAVVLLPAALLASRGLGAGDRVRRGAVLVAAAVIAVLPWTVRNASELDAFVPVSTSSGPTLAGTYNATAGAQYVLPANWIEYWRDPVVAREMAREGGGEIALDTATRRAGMRYLGDHPGYVAKVGYWNVRRMLGVAGGAWQRFEARGMGLSLGFEWAAYVGLWLMLALAVAGLFTRLLRRGGWEIWLTPVLMLGTVVFLVGYQRVRLPADPFIVLLAAVGLVGLLDRRKVTADA